MVSATARPRPHTGDPNEIQIVTDPNTACHYWKLKWQKCVGSKRKILERNSEVHDVTHVSWHCVLIWREKRNGIRANTSLGLQWIGGIWTCRNAPCRWERRDDSKPPIFSVSAPLSLSLSPAELYWTKSFSNETKPAASRKNNNILSAPLNTPIMSGRHR